MSLGQVRWRAYHRVMTKAMLLVLAVLLPSLAQPQTGTAGLAWLAGCWSTVGGEPGSGEQWTAPAGGQMLGVSRTLRAGQVREFEFMQIRDTLQGLMFIALPGGQRETTFPAERVEPRSVSFHLPEHDFPQRVVYESPDDDTVNARIEGLRNGQLRVVRFPMKRTACPLGAK